MNHTAQRSTRLSSRVVRACVAVLTTAALAGCSVLQAGPVPAPPDHGYGNLTVEVGKPFSDAFETFFIEADEPITITKLELIDTPSEMKLVDVVVAGEQRTSNFQFEPVYPPVEHDMGPMVPAIGATLLPLDQQGDGLMGYTIIMAITVTEPGRWVRGGYHLEYEMGGVTYGWDAVAEITVCTPEYLEQHDECVMNGEQP